MSHSCFPLQPTSFTSSDLASFLSSLQSKYSPRPGFDFTGTLPVWELNEYEAAEVDAVFAPTNTGQPSVESLPTTTTTTTITQDANELYSFWENFLTNGATLGMGSEDPKAATSPVASDSVAMKEHLANEATLLHPVPRAGTLKAIEAQLWPLLAAAQTRWDVIGGGVNTGGAQSSQNTSSEHKTTSANTDSGTGDSCDAGESEARPRQGMNEKDAEERRKDGSNEGLVVEDRTCTPKGWTNLAPANTIIGQVPKRATPTTAETEKAYYRIVSVQGRVGDPRKHERIYQHEDNGRVVNMIVQARICDVEWDGGQQILYVGGGNEGCAQMHKILESIMDADAKFYLGVTTMQPWVLRTEEDDFLLLVTVPGHVEISAHGEDIGRVAGNISKRRIERGMFAECTFTMQTKARIEKTLGRPRRTWSVTWVLEATRVVTYAATPQAASTIPRLAMIVEEEEGHRRFYDLVGCSEDSK